MKLCLQLIIARVGIRFFANVQINTLFAIVFLFCVMGAYSINSSLFDASVMLGFGLLAYVMRKVEFPVAPFVIAFSIGPMFESHLRSTLLWSKGDLSVFVTRPFSLVFILFSILSVIWALRRREKRT